MPTPEDIRRQQQQEDARRRAQEEDARRRAQQDAARRAQEEDARRRAQQQEDTSHTRFINYALDRPPAEERDDKGNIDWANRQRQQKEDAQQQAQREAAQRLAIQQQIQETERRQRMIQDEERTLRNKQNSKRLEDQRIQRKQDEERTLRNKQDSRRLEERNIRDEENDLRRDDAAKQAAKDRLIRDDVAKQAAKDRLIRDDDAKQVAKDRLIRDDAAKQAAKDRLIRDDTAKQVTKDQLRRSDAAKLAARMRILLTNMNQEMESAANDNVEATTSTTGKGADVIPIGRARRPNKQAQEQPILVVEEQPLAKTGTDDASLPIAGNQPLGKGNSGLQSEPIFAMAGNRSKGKPGLTIVPSPTKGTTSPPKGSGVKPSAKPPIEKERNRKVETPKKKKDSVENKKPIKQSLEELKSGIFISLTLEQMNQFYKEGRHLLEVKTKNGSFWVVSTRKGDMVEQKGFHTEEAALRKLIKEKKLKKGDRLLLQGYIGPCATKKAFGCHYLLDHISKRFGVDILYSTGALTADAGIDYKGDRVYEAGRGHINQKETKAAEKAAEKARKSGQKYDKETSIYLDARDYDSKKFEEMVNEWLKESAP